MARETTIPHAVLAWSSAAVLVFRCCDRYEKSQQQKLGLWLTLLEKALKEEGVLNCYCTLAQINYPWIREKFEGELAKGGLTTLMAQDAYKVKRYFWHPTMGRCLETDTD